MATLTRRPTLNRFYITGDVEPIRRLLSEFRARMDGATYWLPLRQESAFRAALKNEVAYQEKIASERAAWDAAKSAIPSDYKIRHGAMGGGVVILDGEPINEPGITAPSLPWEHIATHEMRVRDLAGESLGNGRVMDSETLYRAITLDGRPIYRIASSHGFGDDLRETYYLPPDLWERMMAAEVRMRGITVEAAKEWLARYRGCVGTELYEYAAEQPIGEAPIAGLI